MRIIKQVCTRHYDLRLQLEVHTIIRDTQLNRITWPCMHVMNHRTAKQRRWIQPVRATSMFPAPVCLQGLLPKPLPLHVQSQNIVHQRHNYTVMYLVQWSIKTWIPWKLVYASEMQSLYSLLPSRPSISLQWQTCKVQVLTSGSAVSDWLSDSLPLPVLLPLQLSYSWDCRMYSIMNVECSTCTMMRVCRFTNGWPITVCGFRSICTHKCR